MRRIALVVALFACREAVTLTAEDGPAAAPDVAEAADVVPGEDSTAEIAETAGREEPREDGGSVPDPAPEPGSDPAPEAAPDPAPDALPDSPADSSAPAGRFAILTLNLHCLKLDGTTFATNDERFSAIAAAVADAEAKWGAPVAAIAAQEACVAAGFDAVETLRSRLTVATGTEWSATSALAHVGWEGTPDEAEERLAVLAPGPISDAGSLEHRVQGSLRRVMVHGRVPAGDTPVRVASVHIDHEDAAVRLAQAREAVAWVVPLADPSLDVVVAGDFNATETSPPLAAAASFGFANLAEGLGAGRIDHVLAHRGGAFAKDGARIVFDGGETPVVSDHPGVVVTLRPEPAVDVTRTRVRATADLPDGSWLAVRGSAAPLSWDRGWPMLRTGPAAHLLVLTEVAAGTAFEFKCLADDTAWQAGGNVAATGGQDTEVAPAF